MNDTTTRPTITIRRAVPRVTLALVVALSGIAMTAATADADADITVDITIVDGHGHPFRKGNAGAIACPVEGWSVPCTALVAGNDSNGDGHVQLTVAPDVAYIVNGFATDTGWRDPDYIAPDGTTFHFSPAVTLTGAQLNGTTFVVARPTGSPPPPHEPGTVELQLRVVDGNGQPFPAGYGGVMVCNPKVTNSCEGMIFGGTDADGIARVRVKANTTYSFTALVHDIGWTCDYWTSPTGGHFWFSDPVVAKPGQMRHHNTFTIVPPTCP